MTKVLRYLSSCPLRTLYLNRSYGAGF